MTKGRALLLIYLLLVIASNIYRGQLAKRYSTEQVSKRDMQSVSVMLPGDAPVNIAYRRYGSPEAPVVIALHGSPAATGFSQLAPPLAERFQVIVPHLPGFGASTPRIPDYSVRAHAAYVHAMMKKLELESAHFVGYSMGGGVALALYDEHPQQVRSLTLLSAIGVQELEMFGSYHLNHALHAVQLAGLNALEWGIPHFGALDRSMLNSRYARNFYDTDQRPLRGILETFAPPLLIVHGESDNLVPYAAAVEHARIVPHATLESLPGGHGLVFQTDTPVTAPIADFLERVEKGSALVKEQARSERIALAAEPLAKHVQVSLEGIALVLALMTLALSTLISEDAACIAAGLLVAGGMISFWSAAMTCLFGIYVGDAMLFYLGRHLGAPSLQRPPMRWFFSAKGIDAAKAWFVERGPATIIISRFVPGTRFPTYVAAGALGQSFVRFSLWFLLAAILWTPALVALSAAAGNAIWQHFDNFSKYALPVLGTLVIVLLLLLRVVLPLTTHRGRRLMLGRWRRLTRWEFWPRWAFYPPVVAYVLYLGLRYRSPTLFTAANPAIPDGGFIGESKRDILRELARTTPAHVATTQSLTAGAPDERHGQVRRFMEHHALAFPVVLKPDVGERGSDVCIARSDEHVIDYLREHHDDTLVQAFAPGHEFGVFYVRLPSADRGQIFAITDKRPPNVCGDGVSTLEQLILDDDRAVCMAPTYLERHAQRLFEIPAKGQQIALVDIGTHSRGCAFFDGEWLRTPALESAIDKLSRSYAGFYFGRYDIRTPDADDFARGENFKIVELNGVTSEATNIYDPKNSLWHAYRTLAEQWTLAFAIGKENHARGAAITPALKLLKRVVSRN